MLGQYQFFCNVSVSVLLPWFLGFHGIGSITSVPVSTAGDRGFGTRFSGDFLHFSNFCTILMARFQSLIFNNSSGYLVESFGKCVTVYINK